MSLVMTKKERDEFLAGVHIGILSVPRDGAGPLTCPDAPQEIRVVLRPERWLSADFAKRFATLSNATESG